MGFAFVFYTTLVFILVASTLLFPMNKYVPLDRRLVSVFGAILCVLIMFIFDEGDGINIGGRVDFPVIIVLTSIMAINFILLKQDFVKGFLYSLKELIAQDVNKGYYWMCIFSFIASPFILNDGLCLMIVHPLLDAFVINDSTPPIENSRKSSKVKAPFFAPSDPFYMLIGVACSANIGSVLTYSGNPQNILIAAHLSKYMNCGIFFFLMLFPALISWGITIYFINFYRLKASREYYEKYYKTFEKVKKSHVIVNKHQEINNIIHNESIILNENFNSDLENGVKLNTLESQSADYHQNDDEETENDNFLSNSIKLKSIKHNSFNRANSALTTVILEDLTDPNLSLAEKSKKKKKFKEMEMRSKVLEKWDPLSNSIIVSFFFTLLVLLLFFSSFPLGGLFASISVVMIILTIFVNYYELNVLDRPQDIILRKKYLTTTDRLEKINQTIEDLFLNLDYNLLFIFVGIFIVSGSFLMTKIPNKIFEVLALKDAFHKTSSLLILTGYIIFASQLVGNVPVVFMVQEEIKNIPERNKEIFGWMVLSFVSTVAGNFTLVGSAANIIVVEKAIRHNGYPVDIGAIPHFKLCGLITLVSIIIGIAIISFESIFF